MPNLYTAFKHLTTYGRISTLSTAHLNYTIQAYIQNGHLDSARQLFDQNQASWDSVVWNRMITGYVRSNQILHARDLFDKMPVRDVVSWNALLSGLHKAENPGEVYMHFVEMGRDGIRPNAYTMSIVITAFLGSSFDALLPQIHARIVCLALNGSMFVGSALLRGYAVSGDKMALARVFDEILVKNVITWNALVLGYMELGCVKEAQLAFDAMPEKNVVSLTILVNGYLGKKIFDKAWSIFSSMTEKNVVSWTVMIRGYALNANFLGALKLFLLMLRSGVQPNHFTYSSVLEACAGCSSIIVGSQVHSRFIKSGVPADVILFTSILDMYAKCGDIDAAFHVFESMPEKNLATWNSMIGGYARHGLATRALEVFDRMRKALVMPDQVTFINVLSACGHGGLVEEGELHFYSMETKYGTETGVEHYACMVDLYGRAGQLAKAEKLIKTMPFEPDLVVWGALLGACGVHSSLQLGEYAAEGIYKLEKDHPAVYSVLSKIHSEKGVWNNVVELKKMITRKRVKKQHASSWTESPYA